jgi:hypothetical protein
MAERTDTMKQIAGEMAQAKRELDALNDGYQQQAMQERVRRDVQREYTGRRYAYLSGKLAVHIEQQIAAAEEECSYLHLSDCLTEADVMEALRLDTPSRAAYWSFLEAGGALGYAAWQRYESEYTALTTKCNAGQALTADETQTLYYLTTWLLKGEY